MKDYAKWQELIATANGAPADAAARLKPLPKAIHFAPGEISRLTYAEHLNQLACSSDTRHEPQPGGDWIANPQ
jgi:hypothetical protein